MNKVKMRNPKFIVPIIILAFLFLFPLLKPGIYYLSFGFILFAYIALACSWNIIGGYAGYLSFGHVAFFGIGAYTSALFLINFGLSPFYTCLVGGIVAAIVAGIFGYPCLRLKGPYFALATLCLALIMPVVASHLEFAHTVVGIWMPTLPFEMFTSRTIFYEVMLVLASVIILICRHIEKLSLA
jgi:amino acid/amide ABC transporter membrane protein 2, HAAT family (TC 3.A.1.4.-)